MDDQTYYDDGTKIAFLPGAPDENKGSGDLCASLQNGANVTGAELKVLVQKLQEHGYKKGVNDISKGELTVNWNSHANRCNGSCASPASQIKGGQRIP